MGRCSINSMEQPASYYDEIFRTSQAYALPPDQAPWSFLWMWCAEQIDPDDSVLELGCGPGHLASLLKCRSYLGIDFSHVAIGQAMRRCPDKAFLCGGLPLLLHWVRPWKRCAVIACEFLEHVTDDLRVIELLEHQGRVVATLPKKDSPGHVRWFRGAGEVVDRYRGLLEIEDAIEWPSHIGIVGRRL